MVGIVTSRQCPCHRGKRSGKISLRYWLGPHIHWASQADFVAIIRRVETSRSLAHVDHMKIRFAREGSCLGCAHLFAHRLRSYERRRQRYMKQPVLKVVVHIDCPNVGLSMISKPPLIRYSENCKRVRSRCQAQRAQAHGFGHHERSRGACHADIVFSPRCSTSEYTSLAHVGALAGNGRVRIGICRPSANRSRPRMACEI